MDIRQIMEKLAACGCTDEDDLKEEYFDKDRAEIDHDDESIAADETDAEFLSEESDEEKALVADEEELSKAKIRPVMGFEKLMELLFEEQHHRIGRIALRKVLHGEHDKLTLRERTVLAESIIRLISPIATDRTIYSRIDRKLREG